MIVYHGRLLFRLGEENRGDIRLRELERFFLEITLERKNGAFGSLVDADEVPAPAVFVAADQAVGLGVPPVFRAVACTDVVEFENLDVPDFL